MPHGARARVERSRAQASRGRARLARAAWTIARRSPTIATLMAAHLRRARTALFLALALAAARVSAEPAERLRFAWVRGQGADGCAAQGAIAERVGARLGRDPFAADAKRSIEAILTRAGGSFRAEIYVRDAAGALVGQRALTSDAADCASLEAASVLAVALAIDPEAALAPRPAAPPEPAPAPAPAPLAPPPVPPRMPAIAPPVAAPAPPPPLLGASGLALRAGPGFGLLPRVAGGLSLAGHVSLARAVELTGEALWMPEARTDDARFAFGLTAFSLGACVPVVRLASADFAACAAIWGGALHAVVYALEPETPGDYAWAAASAAPRLRLRLGERVHAELGAHLLVPLTRRPFVIAGVADPVFRQAPVTLLPFAGLGANFP
jgi:hypothetical protein